METFSTLTVDAAGPNNSIFIVTMRNPPENRLTKKACLELIEAYRQVESRLGSDAEGAVILRGENTKFFTTGLDLNERKTNSFASTDGFYPLLHTILDFPFPTIALITGHVFGGACLLTLAHDYRIMNSERGFWQMPPVNIGLHHDGMGSLVGLKLVPQVARKVLLEAHKYTGKEAFRDGIIDQISPPTRMLEDAIELAEKWKSKAKMGVYGMLRDELWGRATRAYANNSYVHRKETAREPKAKL